MKAQVLKDKNIAELNQLLEDSLREQFNLRMQKGMNESLRPHLFKRVRREIARIKTMMNQKKNNKGAL